MTGYALAPGALVAGKYRIVRELGAGGMGTVYLAENQDIGRQVAIKVLHAKLGEDPAVRQRFRQEARTSAAIAHPGIVDVLDLGETQTGETFIVMERLEGQTLGDRLKQRGQLSLNEAVSILCEALDAIAAAHAKGIVHRDLKPDNLFLVWRPRWCVKVLDFGISRFLENEDVRLTATNMTMGSVLYMPPEQARDARSAGPPADLYALGATLYHVLTGTPPFMGQNYPEVLSGVLNDVPKRPDELRADIPEGIATLIMQLLLKDPVARPQTATAVRKRLLELVPDAKPPEAPATADALGETMAPPSAELGETAAASLPPSSAPALKIPKGAATSSIAGEVDRIEAATRRKKRTPLLLVAGGAVVATVAGLLLAKSSHTHTVPDAPDAVSADAPALDPAVTDAAPRVIDATSEIDAGTRVDAGRPTTRADASVLRRADAAVDAAPTRKDSGTGLIEIQPPPE